MYDRVHPCDCVCVRYQEGQDAPLGRLPFEAAVDVGADVDQDHDAPLHPVEVLLEQLSTHQPQTSTLPVFSLLVQLPIH